MSCEAASCGPADSATEALRVLWIESRPHNSASGLAWLRQRVQAFEFSQRQVALLDHAWPSGSGRPSRRDRQRLTERIDCGVERIIVPCVNRLDYPVELVVFLQQTCPEVPLAVASDSWWDGRRRTGLTTPGHLTLAWYRWWDGWVDWLQGCSPTLFEVVPAPWPVLSCQSPAIATASHGLIVGNCRQTTDAWALVANTAGHSTACITWQQFQHQFSTPWSQPLPHWVLWDDTSLDTIPLQASPKPLALAAAEVGFASRSASDGDGAEQGTRAQCDEAAMRIFFEYLSQSVEQRTRVTDPSQPHPTPHGSDGILGIVAVDMPRGDWALRHCASPGRELLGKPSGGQGFMRLLSQAAPRTQPRASRTSSAALERT